MLLIGVINECENSNALADDILQGVAKAEKPSCMIPAEWLGMMKYCLWSEFLYLNMKIQF